MSMNFFKAKVKVTLLPRLFIALFLAVLQFIEADLPNKDRLDAIHCVREFFGDDFVKKSFLAYDDSLSNGEYLGDLCEDLTRENFKKEIKRELQEMYYDYDGEEIKQCLAMNHKKELFDKYRTLGAGLLNHSWLNSQTQKSEGLSTESEVIEDTSSVYDELLSSDIYFFMKGLCKSKEEVEFENLKGDDEKSEILSCLGKCAGKLMERIENILVFARSEAIQLLKAKITKIDNISPGLPDSVKTEQGGAQKNDQRTEFQTQMDNLTNGTKITQLANTFLEGFERYDKERSIEVIEKLGKMFLDNYSEFYHHLNNYIHNYDDKSDNGLGRLDINLYVGFSLYEKCSNIGCGMTRNSTPFYNLIQEVAKAKDPNPDVSKISIEHVEPTLQEKEWYTPENRTFFKTLVGIWQTESNESQQSPI